MCRIIKALRRLDVPATDDEIRAAALQYVRKVSGFRAASKRHAEAFDAAVDEVAETSKRLLDKIARSMRAASGGAGESVRTRG